MLPLLLPPLPLPQLLQHHPLEEQLSPELMTALGMLWQPLCAGRALGLRLEEVAEEEEGVVEEEEVEVGGNQLLSLCSSSSLSRLPLTCESWEHSPASLKEKEIKPTHS